MDSIQQKQPVKIKKRKIIVFLWSLVPWICIGFGLHHFHSIFWSFFLYHGVCLLPAIIYNQKHWRKHLDMPTWRELGILAAAAVAFSLCTFYTYSFFGDYLVDRGLALLSMYERGFHMSWFIPLSIYFCTINPAMEELFWRGVVLNELCDNNEPIISVPGIWTNVAFACWHFLIIRLFVSPPFVPIAVIIVFSVGLYMSWLYRRRNSLILPALYHAIVFDLAVAIILGMVLYMPIRPQEQQQIAPLLHQLQ